FRISDFEFTHALSYTQPHSFTCVSSRVGCSNRKNELEAKGIIQNWIYPFALLFCVCLTATNIFAQTPDIFFDRDIMPIFSKAGCNAAGCHGTAVGQDGFALSLFSAEPDKDYMAITHDADGRRINRVEPQQSLLLLKATGQIPHKSDRKISTQSLEYLQLLGWIKQGAKRDAAKQPKLDSLTVTPTQLITEKGHRQYISATAKYTAGQPFDVTPNCRYTTTNDKVVTVDKLGGITVTGYGQAYLTVTYMGSTSLIQVVSPQPLSAAFPSVPANNQIDTLVFDHLKALGIPPSDLCTDEVFVRRVYLDVIGRLPTQEQAQTFLADTDLAKRSKLIDQLLASDAFADFAALKWSDLLRIKSEFPSNLWPNAVQAYYQWVRSSIMANKPYDQFVRELLVSSGSNFREPTSNYYRALADRDPQGFAEQTAMVFMGARMSCARCHAHPTESWTPADNQHMAAFFSNVRFKNTQEWKEQIVFIAPWNKYKDKRTGEVIDSIPLGGEKIDYPASKDSRDVFAGWLTDPQNPWFARNIVNRVWYWLNGRGIVHEPDDMRPSNPPSNPKLLAYLEKQLVDNHYDLKHIYRLILNSRTYQLSAITTPANSWDQQMFSHYMPRRLTAEQVMDAINQVTQTTDTFTSRIPEPYTVLPQGTRAVQLEDGSIGLPILSLFGRPTRDSSYESERCNDTSMSQALFMINAEDVSRKVSRSPYLKELLKNQDDEQVINGIYLTALSRTPSAEKMQQLKDYFGKVENRRDAVSDLLWAVLNSREFLFNH
ncbi:MAG TPA: hypothetical protein DER01_01970, partial [Phycisphaerales bacterium]|nr:hypothetical protein [Phycisphaerales bacterium]